MGPGRRRLRAGQAARAARALGAAQPCDKKEEEEEEEEEDGVEGDDELLQVGFNLLILCPLATRAPNKKPMLVLSQ